MENNNLFKNRLDQLGIGRQVNAAMIVSRSQKIIHDKFGTHGDNNLRVLSYRNGVLKIQSSSSAWSAECRGITTELQTKPVERIVFVFGHQEE
jgi:hypothetical protein